MNWFFFFFDCFLFINVPEPGEEHHTPSPATHICVGEIQTSQLSEVLANCGVRGVWHVCVDDTLCCCGCATAEFRSQELRHSDWRQQTAFTAAVLTTADPNPFNSGPTAEFCKTRRVVRQQQCVIAAHDIKRHGQSSACCCARSTTRFRSQTHFPPIHAPT